MSNKSELVLHVSYLDTDHVTAILACWFKNNLIPTFISLVAILCN